MSSRRAPPPGRAQPGATGAALASATGTTCGRYRRPPGDAEPLWRRLRDGAAPPGASRCRCRALLCPGRPRPRARCRERGGGAGRGPPAPGPGLGARGSGLAPFSAELAAAPSRPAPSSGSGLLGGERGSRRARALRGWLRAWGTRGDVLETAWTWPRGGCQRWGTCAIGAGPVPSGAASLGKAGSGTRQFRRSFHQPRAGRGLTGKQLSWWRPTQRW